MDIHLEIHNSDNVNTEELLTLSCNSLMHYTPQYLEFLSRVLINVEVAYLVARYHGELKGLLPLAICNDSNMGTVINSLPFFGSHGGPIVVDRDNSKQINLDLLHAFKELAIERQSRSATLIENPFHPLDDILIAASGGSVVDDRIGQFTRLPQGKSDIEEALFSSIHVKTRNAIRKGQKYGQRILRRTDSPAIEWLQKVHEQSIQALGGIAKPLNIFQTLMDIFDDKARVYIGECDNQPTSGLFVILYGNTVEYFTPVIESEFKNKQLLSSLIFSVMADLTREGYSVWNWGGTWRSQEGVYRFKKRWGAQDYPYRYLNQVMDPDFKFQSKNALVKSFPFFYLFKY
ncbi:GNAT family N-acetyltransferase [Acaryochloris marina]|uniref:BioF2-like acetyltransferase domain-containing protein n=1 Tax=Acaryochloris marina (strain MBIC 11017) TaxID=329726 RepID=B0BZG5_ACAM1|nr:GNAT family N-acetyltransferase [Acaryochloris marina]ABW30710.1 hypothetical protein AM1_5765 [Acaryochloris marina MBIC11017]BDM79490.1 hypothetical protein AM10699_23580 [Acaryochloris marina MBIC10699]